ncbi:T9SS type A sorting domain-containing protein [Pseudoflavitalea sp. G-6-1-2]|uniref:T9SS type A sorting domain-containing protein n=1 Tax=Pseudoflavitalea sp. G-6-1-2 TaxID=2728841 RepID=UPI00146E8423|nr:T9SS type A sorting domain-containing protein [Pseudoflavitalea sp. G-6-1-2]NML22752.1 T9SS type A sorting domain-containing protein [Pseudoflavitalea sp. G-6-1-2]
MQTQVKSGVCTGCNGLYMAMLSCLCLLLASPALLAQNTKLIISSGTTLKATGNNLVLQNTDLQCDGTLDASAANLLFTGSANTFINGAGSKTVQTFTLNTSPSATLSLLAPVTVSGTLIFQNGLIDLTNQQLTLSPAALLQGESETSHTLSTAGGSVTIAQTGIVNPNQLNAGNLGAMVTTSANLGNFAVTRYNKAGVNPGNPSQQGITRMYLIVPQNNSALNATFRFYYLDEELNGNSSGTLSLWKSNDGITWSSIGADTRNAAGKYVEKSGIADFSFWTLSSLLNPLPLTLLSFRVSCDNDVANIQWQTGSESSLSRFEVERSDNGTDWKKIQQVTATNNTNGFGYSIKDADRKATAFYRLKIVEWSGSVTYSPVFRGGCAELPLPFTVYPNPVTDQAVARISVRQFTNATLQIFNMNGQLMMSNNWQLQPGLNQYLLHFSRLNPGRYIVRLVLPDQKEETHIIKQ